MNLIRKEINDAGYKKIILRSSSAGNQSKYTNSDIWVKLNYLGYEDYAEYFVSKLLEYSNIKDYVKYDLCIFKEENGCYSKNMLTSGESLITITKILDKYDIFQRTLDNMNSVQQRFDTVIEVVKDYTNLDLTTYFSNLLALDAVILNEDRHLNNIAVIYNESTCCYREAPFFDNGLSLLSDINEYRLETQPFINMRNVKARPFSSSFKKQYSVLTPTIKFDKEKVVALIESLNKSDDKILKRIGYVLEHSLNNYKELFIDSLDSNKSNLNSFEILGWDS